MRIRECVLSHLLSHHHGRAAPSLDALSPSLCHDDSGQLREALEGRTRVHLRLDVATELEEWRLERLLIQSAQVLSPTEPGHLNPPHCDVSADVRLVVIKTSPSSATKHCQASAKVVCALFVHVL